LLTTANATARRDSQRLPHPQARNNLVDLSGIASLNERLDCNSAGADWQGKLTNRTKIGSGNCRIKGNSLGSPPAPAYRQAAKDSHIDAQAV